MDISEYIDNYKYPLFSSSLVCNKLKGGHVVHFGYIYLVQYLYIACAVELSISE